MKEYMQIKIRSILFFITLLFIPAIGYSQVILLSCKTSEGKNWGTLQIDLKERIIIDKNIFQKVSADYLEKWKGKYYREKGQDYKTKDFDADKSANKFKITKINDEKIFGEIDSFGHYKTIEINRYSLQMTYPEMPTNDVFQCSKIEKAF